MELRDDQFVKGTLVITDRQGNAAAVDGLPVVASDNEAAFTVSIVDTQGAGFEVTVTPTAGVVTPAQGLINGSVDADLGAGVETVSFQVPVTILGGKATGVSVNFGAPQDLP